MSNALLKRRHLSFKEWIELKGINYVSKTLKVKTATVRHWRRGHCYPRVEQMRTIKRLTKGLVGYEQIIDGGGK